MGTDRVMHSRMAVPSQPNMSHHFQLQHLATKRDAKVPEDAAINLKLLGRLGHNAVGKKHYCLSQCFFFSPNCGYEKTER